MRYRRAYYNRDPDKVPERAGFMLHDLTERGGWWRDILPLRTMGGLWMFFERQPADVRFAGQQTIQDFMDDPKERPVDLYVIFRGKLHEAYRLDEEVLFKLLMASQRRVEEAEQEVRAGTRLSASVVPLRVAHDQFRLAYEAWRYAKPPTEREHGNGASFRKRAH